MTRQLARHREEIAARSNSAIDDSRQALFDLSKDIHSHPELNYQERYSSSALAGFLESRDIQVERSIGGLDTAFRATIPGGAGEGPTIAVLAEYDALPEIGTAADTISLRWPRWAPPWGCGRTRMTCPDARW